MRDMRRRDAILAAVGVSLLVLNALAIHKTELTGTNLIIVAGECRAPATVIEPPGGKTGRAAILIHGLSANRRVMRILGETLAGEDNLRVYLVDLPGHGDNTDAFSFPHAEECTAAVVERLIRDGAIAPAQTAVVGHSMGGEIAIRLTDYASVAATVAISPAPMILPRRMPSNLLVLSAQYDFPQLRQQAQVLALSAGGDRTTAEDFEQLRAFHLQNVAYANHTSVIIDPTGAEQAASWIEAALDPATLRRADVAGWSQKVRRGSTDVGWRPKTGLAMTWTVRVAPLLGFIGLLLMFPLAARVALRQLGFTRLKSCVCAKELPGSVVPKPLALLEGAVFAFITVLLLKIEVPLKFLHLYSGAYLVSLLLIVGSLLLAFNRRAAKDSWIWDARSLLASSALGFVVILAFGAWLNWRLTDVWMNGPRWIRLAGLVPFCFVFIFAEEMVLGPVGDGKRRIARFVVFALLRVEVWLAAVIAFYVLASGNVLIAVLFPTLAGFSVLHRLGTDEIRTRTGSAVAAAAFGAILAAWLIAAVFPLT